MSRSEEPLGGADGSVEKRYEYERVMTALATLSVRDREILRLAAFELLSHSEIGTVLGIRSSLVRSKVYRARKRLNDALDGRSTPPLGKPGHSEGEGGSQGMAGEVHQ